MADDRCDLRVLVHVSEDALADRRVLLHVAALLERERSRLLEKPGWQADLADVVNESAEVRLIADLVRESHALGDVARVDRDRSRVASRVLVSRIESCDQRSRELEVRALKRVVGVGKIDRELALLLVQAIEPLRRHRRDQEQRERPRRDPDVHECEEGDDRRVDRRGREHDRHERPA